LDLGGVVSNDLAVVWCERHTQSEWIVASTQPLVLLERT